MKISKLETKQTNFIKDKFKSKLKKIKLRLFKFKVPKNPYKKIQLHKNKTDTKEPRIKYFNPASVEKVD
jgi:hypothetical protein